MGTFELAELSLREVFELSLCLPWLQWRPFCCALLCSAAAELTEPLRSATGIYSWLVTSFSMGICALARGARHVMVVGQSPCNDDEEE